MKRRLLVPMIGVILSVAMSAVHAHGYRGHGGHGSRYSFSFGVPLYWGTYPRPYYRPYYYEPRTVIIEREPPVYIQRQPATVVPAPVPNVWYYCPDPAGYYPYVQNCAQAWVSVDPHSVAPPR